MIGLVWAAAGPLRTKPSARLAYRYEIEPGSFSPIEAWIRREMEEVFAKGTEGEQ